MKKKKNFFVESLDKCRRLEVREKARNVFCDESTSVWPQRVTQRRIFIKFFFRFRSDFLAFFVRISYLNFLEFKEFNKQLFHSRLLDTGYSQLRASLAICHLISNARSWNNC